MKKLILPLMFGLVLGSCSRDNDDAVKTTEPDTSILLTKVVNVEENGDVETSTFTYDGNKVKASTSGYERGWSVSNTFTYVGDLIESSIRESTGYSDNVTYTYNTANKLEKSVEVSVGTPSSTDGNVQTTTTTRNYTYNTDGTVVVNQNEKITNSVKTQYNSSRDEKTTYTIQNELITKAVEENVYGTTTTTYKYDQKNAPLRNAKGISALVYEGFDTAIGGQKNNIISSEEVEVSKDGSTITRTATYAYEYNSFGYPTKVTVTNKSSSDAQEAKETYTFTYNK